MENDAYESGRRNFIKLAALSGVGLCIGKTSVGEEKEARGNGSLGLAASMGKSRTLGSGKAAMKVSALGFGCMGINYHRGKHPDRKLCMNLIHEAIERGVRLFDTAESYGYHKNELLVGEALKGYSDRVFVSSKFGHKFVNGVQVKTEEDSSPANIRRVCENSLRNLGVETLGIFYQHRADPNTPVEVVAETVGDLIKEGKVLHFGLCEVNVDTIRRAHAVCPVTAIQSEYHLMHRTVEENGVLKLCEDLGIGFVPYSPINRGFLGGLINEYTRFDAEALDGNVYHYRDKSGLKCDAVVHLRNGVYGLVEIKLGGDRLISEGIETLKKLYSNIDTTKMKAPAFKMVLIGVGEMSYRRSDGIYIVPLSCLKH